MSPRRFPAILLFGLVFFLAFHPRLAQADTAEAGVVTVSQSGPGQWHSVTLSETYTSPVIVMGPPSFGDAAPATMRVRSVTATGFEYQVDEWDYLDGAHGSETVSFLAVETGDHTLSGSSAAISAGVRGSVTDAWVTQSLTGFSSPPVILVQCVTANEGGAVTVRVRNVATTGFEMRLQEEQNADGTHAAEDVAWVAIEPGSNGGLRQYEARATGNSFDETWDPANFTLAGYSATSPLIASMQTFAGSDPAALRHRNLGSTSVEFLVEEETSSDTEVGHNDESVGYIVVASAGELPLVQPQPPDAANDSAILHTGGKVMLHVTANDTDVDGDLDPSTLAISTPPSQGTAVVDPVNGRITYTHTGGGVTPDSFHYTVADSLGQTSSPAEVSITIDNSDRIPAPHFVLPPSLPAAYKLENAFPGISFSQPLAVATPPGETDRLFVVEKGGRIQIVKNITTTPVKTPTPFLDLATLVNGRGTESLNTSGEQGLLGLAFHPDYATNGQFFVFYTPSINGQRHDRLARFTVSGNPDIADNTSELVFFQQIDQAGNHNGGDLHFGPDGYLYISLGDEGGGNDTWNNSQTLTKDFFSGIFRLDVDKLAGNELPNDHPSIVTHNGAAVSAGGLPNYLVPADNPWADGDQPDGTFIFNGTAYDPDLPGSNVRTEFYAVGLRNPWRMSFDSLTGELYVADVGQGAREEVNKVVKGGNYGWAFKEGFINGPKIAQAPTGWTGDDPIHDYPRSDGNSITGGIVYHGVRFAELEGAYVFCDYASGNIWALREDGGGGYVREPLGNEGGIAGIGPDPSNGDVLFCDLGNGVIRRLVEDPAVLATAIPPNLTQTGAFADLATLTPNPGVVAYDPNLDFWSDYAVKSRWFAVPELADDFTWHRDAPWTFPQGAVWIKHFDLESERGNPATRFRLETRLLVKTTDSVYGLSYQWNPAGTEATLVPSEGVNLDIPVMVGGSPQVQKWRIPGRNECNQCHTDVAGGPLSFNTRQLNAEATIFGVLQNQISGLDQAGYFTNPTESVNTLPWFARHDDATQSLEFRVRSYLAVNCVSCHQPGGVAPNTWDARPEISLTGTGLINGIPNNDGGNPSFRLVVPGDSTLSILRHRLEPSCCGLSPAAARMPPLATSELDDASIQLVTNWIDNELSSYQTYDQWRLANFGSTTSPEGDPDADPDGDGCTNRNEFLTHTNPNNRADKWSFSFDMTSDTVAFTFDRVFNRGFQLEVSSDLRNWSLWDVPGNNPSFPGSTITNDILQGPVDTSSEPRMFYRWHITEP